MSVMSHWALRAHVNNGSQDVHNKVEEIKKKSEADRRVMREICLLLFTSLLL